MTAFVVRKAVKEDSAGIISLIKNIAEYEKMTKEVILTKEQFEKDGFGPEKLFGCFVAELIADESVDSTTSVVGYALHYNVYSTFKGKSMYLEDLFVYPDHRGKGIGKALLKAVAEEAVHTGCYRLDFIVINWNKDAIEFYKRLNIENLTETEGWLLFRMQHTDLNKFSSS